MLDGNHPEIIHDFKKSERNLSRRIDRRTSRLDRSRSHKRVFWDWLRFLWKGE